MTHEPGTIQFTHTSGSALSEGASPQLAPSGNQYKPTYAKFFRGMSRQTADWYRSVSKTTGLSYWEVQRLKMLSYGIPVDPREFDLSRSSAKNAIYRLTVKLPWLEVVFTPGGYVVRQSCLDQLKQYLEE